MMRGNRYRGLSGPELTEEQKRAFREALNSRLNTPNCAECPGARGFVQVIEFLIDHWAEAVDRMDKASQTMEAFLKLFGELEENLTKMRMTGGEPDGL
jgi:hypothetical protein